MKVYEPFTVVGGQVNGGLRSIKKTLLSRLKLTRQVRGKVAYEELLPSCSYTAQCMKELSKKKKLRKNSVHENLKQVSILE